MFFENETTAFTLWDVLELDQTEVNLYNRGRNFSALSFRMEADTVLEARGKRHHLGDGCLTFVPARLDYRRVAARDRLIVVHFEALNYRAEGIEILRPQHPEALEALFRKILDVFTKKEAGYRHTAAAVFCEILAESYRQSHSEKAPPSRIAPSLDYLHRHFTDADLTVGAAAERSYMSEVYFRRLFRKEYGTSPQRYVMRLRVLHAAGLISTGYHTLKEVAYLSGYSDYKYFATEFRRQMGVPPSKYRYNYEERE